MNSDIIQQEVDLSSKTTISLVGHAAYYAVCSSLDDIKFALDFAQSKQLPIQIIGGGSNLIFSDKGFPGLVINPHITNINPLDQNHIEVGAGVNWDEFVAYAVDRNLGGIEQLSGIPGTVGAAPVQNIGAYGVEVSSIIQSVNAIEVADASLKTFSNQECCFSYRQSIFKKNPGHWLITSVTFAFDNSYQPNTTYPSLNEALPDSINRPTGQELLALIRQQVLKLRRHKSLVYDQLDPDSHSCGSFFTNPHFTPAQYDSVSKKIKSAGLPNPPCFQTENLVKIPAAWIIEQAGFPRGYRQGNVGVSPHHNLALVNYGGSTEELIELATSIQRKVSEIFDIHLEIEPVLID